MIPSSARASVVFPLPDSPTSPSVSPGQTAAETSASAWIECPCCWNTFPSRSKRRSGSRSLSMIGSASVAASSRGSVCARSWKWQRLTCVAPRSCSGGSSRWQISSARPQREANTQPGSSCPSAGRKPAIVSSRPWSLRRPPRGMQRSRPTVYGWRGSCSTASTEPSSTRRPAYRTPTRAHIFAITPRLWLMKRTLVLQLRLEPRDEVEHLRLDRRVEPGRRLVEDQQRRVLRERHGDHDALLHASGELVRIAIQHRARIGDLHQRERLARPVHRLGAADAAYREDLRDLAADADRRVQRRARVLVDHRDVVRAEAPQLTP